MIELERAKKVHFIGIGGIGVSAIARMMVGEGNPPAGGVSGSDRGPSPVTEGLEKLGVKIFFEQTAENIKPDVDLVIYSLSIPDTNPELARARELKIPTFSYPEVLGHISKQKFTIAVSGTHGKTTTTAMIAAILVAAKFDPTVVVGSLLKGSESNFIAGKSEYFVVEACEYKRSFLNLWPKILVITNIDNDHLDYYKDMNDIQSAFDELKAKVPADGKVITSKEYERVPVDFKLQVPGEHNVKNAQAALAVAAALGIERSVAVKALEGFTGTWRRFELKGKTPAGTFVYDDYAHHPTAIRATLKAARELAGEHKVFVVFQPHLYSRTKHSFDDFAQSFKDADLAIIAPIYAAREPVDPTVSGEMLAQAVQEKTGNGLYLATLEEMRDKLLSETRSGDIIMTMGAGDIYHLADDLLK